MSKVPSSNGKEKRKRINQILREADPFGRIRRRVEKENDYLEAHLSDEEFSRMAKDTLEAVRRRLPIGSVNRLYIPEEEQEKIKAEIEKEIAEEMQGQKVGKSNNAQYESRMPVKNYLRQCYPAYFRGLKPDQTGPKLARIVSELVRADIIPGNRQIDQDDPETQKAIRQYLNIHYTRAGKKKE